MNIEKITLGCGCFWCFEAVLQQLEGVESAIPGYAGGAIPKPSYEQICTGTTEHAEVVQIHFDTETIHFKTLLQVFFKMHNPTTLNQQGADKGTQYRSVIFYQNNEQKMTAKKLIDELNTSKQWNNPIVTEITALDVFYPAEPYHHNYYAQHSTQPYCQLVILPKLSLLKKTYASLLKSS